MDASEVESAPKKVHDEDYLSVTIPETAHQISRGFSRPPFFFIVFLSGFVIIFNCLMGFGGIIWWRKEKKIEMMWKMGISY